MKKVCRHCFSFEDTVQQHLLPDGEIINAHPECLVIWLVEMYFKSLET